MFSRRARTILASLTTGMLLFAQAIAVVQACAGLEAMPAMAFSGDIAGQDCHESVPANTPNPNACLQHCTAGDQTTAQVPAVVAGIPGIVVLTVPLPAESAHVFAHAEACELHSPDPPRSLRFCSFQL